MNDVFANAEFANWGVAIATAVIALVTLVVSTIMQSRTLTRAADAQRVSDLEQDLRHAEEEVKSLQQRVSECERGRSELKAEIERLNRREVDLMRRLVNLEDPS